MNINLIGTYGGNTDTNFLTGFFVDDFLAVDAGCLTQALNLEQQLAITDVLISHSHLDHTLSLPFLADNLFDELKQPIRVWADAAVIQALKKHVFNNVIWPDFSVLPSAENPTIVFHEIQPEVPFQIKHIKILPVRVNHVVPCLGFIVESSQTDSSFLYTADTCSTDRIWEIGSNQKNLKIAIADCSFPNQFHDLAVASGHMTPRLLAKDLSKLNARCQVLVYHLKPMYEDVLVRELEELKIPRLVTQIQSTQMTI